MKKIALSGSHGKGLYALVSDVDYERLKKHSWCLDVGGGYPMTRSGGKAYRMHRMILTPPKGLYVDHINRDKMDNRRDNLRIVTNSQNMHNIGIPKSNTSGYKGVTYSNRDRRWIAQVRINYKNNVLGRFKDKKDAIMAREAWNNANG